MVHSVDTLHSDAFAFSRIQAHSAAFTHTRIHLCKQMHSLVYAHTCMHSYASFVMNIQPSFESLVVYLDGQPILVASSFLVDGLRRDGAVLVAHISVCFFFSRAGTFEMHQAENVLECVKMRHVQTLTQNAT